MFSLHVEITFQCIHNNNNNNKIYVYSKGNISSDHFLVNGWMVGKFVINMTVFIHIFMYVHPGWQESIQANQANKTKRKSNWTEPMQYFVFSPMYYYVLYYIHDMNIEHWIEMKFYASMYKQ